MRLALRPIISGREVVDSTVTTHTCRNTLQNLDAEVRELQKDLGWLTEFRDNDTLTVDIRDERTKALRTEVFYAK